jgi:hypothetical protein
MRFLKSSGGNKDLSEAGKNAFSDNNQFFITENILDQQ